MDTLKVIGELSTVIFFIVALIQKIPALSKLDPQVLAISVAFFVVALAMVAGLLPKDVNTILEALSSIFGSSFINDKLYNPVRDAVT